MSVVNNLRVSTISPTLRVVLTNECNGKCFFCHREGCLFSKESPLIMNTKMIEEIASTINEIGLSKVIFTGGEPTLYDGLLKAVYIISESCSDVQMEMTSNGYNIEQILDVQEYLHKITISISSLNEDIFMKYTMVNPYTVIDKLSPLKHLKKAISVVITKENILEIDNIINLFSQNDYDIKLQFVISERQDEQEWEREILHKLFQMYGMFEMKLGSTPMLYRKLDSGSKMKIKLYSLNQWMYDNIFVRQNCLSCPYKKKCTERGCSIRVFPNGWVTPCLNNYKVFNGDSVKKNILDAYKFIML